MKKYILFGGSLLCIAVLLLMTVAPSHGWFGLRIDFSDPPAISGSTHAAFFAGGDGSADSPYLISKPTHLYNLAWLQYIGYFNLHEDANNGRAQSYFKLTAGIDMTGFSALPPIGTTQFPFHGNFDGSGHVISHLKTANLNAPDAISSMPTTAEFTETHNLLAEYGGTAEVGQIMGFFGVVGDYNGSVAAVNGKSDASTGTLDPTAITVQNTALSDCTVQTDSTTATVGLAAGYVNAPLSGIGVSDGRIIVSSADSGRMNAAHVSDHLLVGYCADARYMTDVGVAEVTVYAPQKQVLGAGGGADLPSDGSSAAEPSEEWTVYTEILTVTTVTAAYPSGVGVYASETPTAYPTPFPAPDFAAALQSGFAGEVTVSRTGDTVTHTPASDKLVPVSTTGETGEKITVKRWTAVGKQSGHTYVITYDGTHTATAKTEGAPGIWSGNTLEVDGQTVWTVDWDPITADGRETVAAFSVDIEAPADPADRADMTWTYTPSEVDLTGGTYTVVLPGASGTPTVSEKHAGYTVWVNGTALPTPLAPSPDAP